MKYYLPGFCSWRNQKYTCKIQNNVSIHNDRNYDIEHIREYFKARHKFVMQICVKTFVAKVGEYFT